jgi:hypothetical protein
MPEEHETKTLFVENARLIFRNFAGLPRMFNSEGDRNFHIVLEPELALKLREEGWRIKQLKPRGEQEEGDYHLNVTVNYKTGRPPRCVLITSNNRTELGADEVGMIDVADIKIADVFINGWWSKSYGGGYGGFLKSIFVTINYDAAELKYGMDKMQTPTFDEDDDKELERGHNE